MCKALSYYFAIIGQIMIKAILLMYSQVPNKQCPNKQRRSINSESLEFEK